MKKIFTSAIAFLLMCGCAASPRFEIGAAAVHSPAAEASLTADAKGKPIGDTSPLLSSVFCADPTSIEYDGRLYIYGTCDHQQFEAVGKDGENSYEHIKSLVMISTDDMVNYTYHGRIDVGEIAPWIVASWAPSIISREEADGLTHFYMYFSNSGWGTGVITATSPTGPWSDPLGKPLVAGNTKGLKGCKVPFDPGAVIDDNGVGWLTFGGLGGGQNGRIVKLGDDLLSIDSEITKVRCPCHFEANELNFINGTYVYTYNTDWEDHGLKWDRERDGNPPPACSMVYMTSKTPLDYDSWEYGGCYFLNPGQQGMDYGNNHTHLQKYGDRYYLFYHAMPQQKYFGPKGGFRRICVNEAKVDEDTLKITNVSASLTGVEQIKSLDPYSPVQAETTAADAGIEYRQGDSGITVAATGTGWTYVRGADFGKGSKTIAATASGKGKIEVHKGTPDGEAVAVLVFGGEGTQTVYTDMSLSGVNDLCFVISDGLEFDCWQAG